MRLAVAVAATRLVAAAGRMVQVGAVRRAAEDLTAAVEGRQVVGRRGAVVGRRREAAVRRRAAGAAAIIRYGYVSMPARFRWVSRDEWIGSERAHGFGGSGFALTLWRFRLLGLALY